MVAAKGARGGKREKVPGPRTTRLDILNMIINTEPLGQSMELGAPPVWPFMDRMWTLA